MVTIKIKKENHNINHRKKRFGLTSTQKYRLRKRLQRVDQVIDTLVKSGVQLKSLVRFFLLYKCN